MPQMSWENFETLLEERRDNVRDWWEWDIPDMVWEYALELLRECDGLSDPELNCPSYIVDNIAVNGSWETFDDIRLSYDEYRDLDDDQIADELEQKGDAIAIFSDEKIVLWNLGL